MTGSSSHAPESRPLRRSTRPLGQYLVAGVLLAASVALLGRTVYVGTRHVPVGPAAATTPFPDASERQRRQHDFVGTFATGNQPGDRVLIITADGQVQFHPVGPLANSLASSDTYQVAQLDRHPCLVTARNGIIRGLDIDHVSYFDDVYERTK